MAHKVFARAEFLDLYAGWVRAELRSFRAKGALRFRWDTPGQVTTAYTLTAPTPKAAVLRTSAPARAWRFRNVELA